MSSPPQSRSATVSEPIGADRELALLHVPSKARESFRALFEIDAAMGDVVARSTETGIGRIRLAWWHERLEALDSSPPPAEPRLQAVADHLMPTGVTGSELAALEPGWATLLDPEFDPALIAARGSLLFAIGGKLLGSSDSKLGEAGALYALASVGRRGVPELFERAREILNGLRGHRFGSRCRPLTMLTRAATRDLDREEAEGCRGRAAAMLAHRWSGRVG